MCRRSAGSPLASSLLMLLLPLFMCCLGSVPYRQNVSYVPSLSAAASNCFRHNFYTLLFSSPHFFSSFYISDLFLLCSRCFVFLHCVFFFPALIFITCHSLLCSTTICLRPPLTSRSVFCPSLTFSPSHLTLNFKAGSLYLHPSVIISRRQQAPVSTCVDI